MSSERRQTPSGAKGEHRMGDGGHVYGESFNLGGRRWQMTEFVQSEGVPQKGFSYLSSEGFYFARREFWGM